MGLLSGLGGMLGGLLGGNANVDAARAFAEQARYQPFDMNVGGYTTSFSGNNAYAGLSPQYASMQQQLFGGAGGAFQGLSQLLGQGGVSQDMMGEFANYNLGMPGIGLGDIDPSLANVPTAIGGPLRGQFNQAGSNMLGAIGNFDPNQAAMDYTNQLRAGSQRAEGNAAQNLATNLFSKGILGSTEGSQQLGDMTRYLEEADIGRQIAGKQYAGQEQSRLAGLANQMGGMGMQLGDQQFSQGFALNDSFFNRAMMADELAFSRGNLRAQNRFQNAMQLFGMGNQNIQSQLGAGLGMMEGGQSFDTNLMNQIGLGSYMGTQRSNANAQAYQPLMQARVARNNAISGGISGFLGGMGGNMGVASPQGFAQMFPGLIGYEPQLQNFGLDPNLVPMPTGF